MGWQCIMNRDRWLALHREKLLRQGDLYRLEHGEYQLTNQGKEKVLSVMLQYTGEPGLMLLIEQWYAERFEITGPLSRRATARPSPFNRQDPSSSP